MSPRRTWDPQPSLESPTWQQRVRAAAEDAARRRRARDEERRELARRRAHGLVDRHAARLAEVQRRARVRCDTS